MKSLKNINNFNYCRNDKKHWCLKFLEQIRFKLNIINIVFMFSAYFEIFCKRNIPCENMRGPNVSIYNHPYAEQEMCRYTLLNFILE